MLYPLLFILWSHAYYTYRDRLPAINKLFNTSILILAGLLTLCMPAALFFGLQAYVPDLEIKVIVLTFASGFLTWMIYRLKSAKIIAFLAILIMLRMGFSWFILPHRLENMSDNYYRNAGIEMGKIAGKEPFYLYQYHPGEADIPFHDRLIFYVQRSRMQQVKFTEDDAKPGYYFTFDRDLNNPEATLIKTYQNLKLFHIK